MTTQRVQSQNTLQWALYSGIALIVISMLFLGQEQQSSSFIAQALTIMVTPAIFYLVGVLVCRYLDTPLAGYCSHRHKGSPLWGAFLRCLLVIVS